MEFNYNQFKSQNQSIKKESNENNGPYVGYLSLKDGEEAIVRIMCDKIEDLKVMACHWAFMDGREGWINCPRTPQDPTDMCPYCADKKPLSYRTFIKLIHYVTDEEGKVKALAKVWDRPASFLSILEDRIADYGPLSNIIYKIKRHGTGTATRFDLMPQAPNKYPEDIYIKRENAFDNFNIIGHSVREVSPQPKEEAISKEELPWENIPQTNPASKDNSTSIPNTTNNPGNGFERPRRFYQ